jgi:UDP-2-acetamido-2-deoxy-ribo-hexuluronate aminotransferase
MDTIQCAVVLAKLERFDWEVGERQKIGERYDELLSGKLRMVAVRRDRTSVYAQYTVFVDNRAFIQDSLKQLGIPTAVHYPAPLHRQPAYEHRCRVQGEVVVSEKCSREVLSLPMSADLSEDVQKEIVSRLVELCV